MRNNATTLRQPALLSSAYTDDTSCIAGADLHHHAITLFPTGTGREIRVNLPVELAFDSFH